MCTITHTLQARSFEYCELHNLILHNEGDEQKSTYGKNTVIWGY